MTAHHGKHGRADKPDDRAEPKPRARQAAKKEAAGTAREPSAGAHAGMKMDAGAGAGSGQTKAELTAATRATAAQKAAWGAFSVLALAAGIVFAATTTNLRLGARDAGGAVMPPGMKMFRDTPGEAMKEMAAVDPGAVRFTAPSAARGDQPLPPRIENGVKVFDLEASAIRWNILPYKQVMAYAFNRQVPGPRLRLTEGDRVRVNVTNRLPEAMSVHWHGLILPNDMDGPAHLTSPPIEPGETRTFEFTLRQSGTYFYHAHSDRQQALGMYGALILDPKAPAAIPAADLEYTVQLQEWLEREGYTFPSMFMEGALPNFFTMNGKAYPATETIHMKVGQKILLRLVGSHTSFTHPIHTHGGPFKIVATDGNPVPETAQIEKDTVGVAPAERYDVVWTAHEPGKWLLHCHIPHHTTNNNVEEHGGGGMTIIIDVTR